MSKLGSIGIDVGGTKIRLALFDDAFKIIDTAKFKTSKNKKKFVEILTTCVEELVKKAEEQSLMIAAVGVGVAGSIDAGKGIVELAPNIPILKGFSFNKVLAPICPSHVSLHNDIHAALYGELKLGVAVGYKHVIGVFIGTGIGGAVAINGELHLGASGQAGNIGHYLLHAFGPLAGSERHGILDDFASRLAIAGTAATFAAKNWAPHLLKSAGTDVRNVKGSDLAKAIRAGDKAVEELVRSRVHIVGIVLSNMVDFLSPEMIILGGGLTDSMPKIVRDEIAAGIHAHAIPAARRGLKVVTARHKGHAVAIGAAKLAMDSL